MNKEYYQQGYTALSDEILKLYKVSQFTALSSTGRKEYKRSMQRNWPIMLTHLKESEHYSVSGARSKAALEAIKRGLTNLGFGRWGDAKTRKVEFVTRDGKLAKLHAERDKFMGRKLSERDHIIHDFKDAGHDPEKYSKDDWIDNKAQNYKVLHQRKTFKGVADKLASEVGGKFAVASNKCTILR